MLAKRIIPCLDVKDGQVVKGINFLGLKEVGDAVEMGARYGAEGADELVYLDVSATHEGRKTFVDLVGRIAERINIPFTVGGGISTVDDAARLLDAGADKISVNSAAIANPSLIDEIARKYGSQFIVCAIDARRIDASGKSFGRTAEDALACGSLNGMLAVDFDASGKSFGRLSEDVVACGKSLGRWMATTHGGRCMTDRELFNWAREAQDRGAGEILFTSMDHDGTKGGYACETYSLLAETLSIPVIASGGAGTMADISRVLTEGKADAALAASVFHYGEISIPELKRYLMEQGIPVRI